MIKILHAADLHLDSAFAALTGAQAAQRRREQRAALDRLAQLAADCDLVLLAGDLFDGARVYRDTLDALRRFCASTDAEIFIAPGNHDYFAPGSPYDTEGWGENVHIFTTPELRRVRLPRLNCDVYGAGFTAADMPPLLTDFHVADETVTNVMVLHGDLQPNSPYNALTTDEITAGGLDYLALGHVHAMQVGHAGATTYAYPGCLMGRGFDECGAKGALRVTIEEKQVRTEFVPVAGRTYEILSVAAGDDPLAAIRAALPPEHAGDCYRIELTGEADRVDVAALEDALGGEFFSLSVRDRTVPRKALWAEAGEDTLRGRCLRELKARCDAAEGGDRETAVQAARLLTALMDGREVAL